MKNFTGKISKYYLNDIIWLLSLSILYLLGDVNSYYFGKVLIVMAIFSSIQLIYRYNKHDYIVVFLIFGIMYWLYLLAYYFFEIPYHYLLEFQKTGYTNIVVLLQFVLLRIMFLGISPKALKIPRLNFLYRDNNIVYTIFILLLIIMIPIILITTPLVLSGNYGIETKSSSLLEYAIIFIIAASLYANSRRKQWIIMGIITIYMFLPLLYGKRLAFLMISLLLLNLFFSGKFKFKQILFITIFGFVFVRVFAGLRVGMGNMNLLTFLLGVNDQGVMSNNQGGVIVCSVTYFGLIENEVFDIFFRLKSLLGVLVGTFLPASFNLEEAYVNLYTMKYATIPGNGGLTSIYLYIWGGFIGVVIGGLIFNYLIRNPKNSRLISIYLIFMFATYPRWYAYNMFILLKMGFWLMFFVAVADTIHKYTKKRYLQ